MIPNYEEEVENLLLCYFTDILSFHLSNNFEWFFICPSLDEKMAVEKVAWPDHIGNN